MNERDFNLLATATLNRIEAALEASGADLDFGLSAEGVFEIEFADASRIIVNRNVSVQEIWVAARSGGFHYRWDGSAWRDTRDASELLTALGERISAQAGETVSLV